MCLVVFVTTGSHSCPTSSPWLYPLASLKKGGGRGLVLASPGLCHVLSGPVLLLCNMQELHRDSVEVTHRGTVQVPSSRLDGSPFPPDFSPEGKALVGTFSVQRSGLNEPLLKHNADPVSLSLRPARRGW